VAEKPQPSRHQRSRDVPVPPAVPPAVPPGETGWAVEDERLHDEGFHEEPEGGDIDLGYNGGPIQEEQLAELLGEMEGEDIRPGEGAREELVEGFIEAFNARDLDQLLELFSDDAEVPGLGDDRNGLGSALEDLWERNPGVTATLGRLGGAAVTMLWVSDDREWWRVGMVVFEGSDEVLSLAELVEEPGALEGTEADAPERERDEGATWEEWEEGVEG